MKSNLLLVLLFITCVVHGQVKDPVQWTFSAKKLNNTTYEIHMLASIESGWHIYSQSTPEGGPIPTLVEFTKNPLLAIDKKPKEIGKLQQHHEDLFGVDVKQYSNKLDLVQRVNVKAKVSTALSGSIEFMTCNDHECLPPKTQKFTIALK